MNTLTKTALRILPGAAALALALSATTPASAAAINGLSANGIEINALVENGVKPNALNDNALTKNALAPNAFTSNALAGNGAQATGATFDFDAVSVTGVTLPAVAE